jgi:structural maintenance of chromosome 4
MHAQNKGDLSGIHGRLGDLGSIDKMYDCAITTACSHLDYIVVDQVRQAEACINFLRINRVGLGRFICIDRFGMNPRQLTPP